MSADASAQPQQSTHVDTDMDIGPLGDLLADHDNGTLAPNSSEVVMMTTETDPIQEGDPWQINVVVDGKIVI